MAKPTVDSFLPKDYEPESGGSDFLKLKQGDNKFRIVSNAIVGKEGWKDNKPFRRGGQDAKIDPSEVDNDAKSGKPKINNYMACYVYSHDEEKVMIASFTQVGIKKAIAEYAGDEDWGNPSGYDITINRTGEGLSTKYTIKPSVPKPLKADVLKVVDEAQKTFDLEGALSVK